MRSGAGGLKCVALSPNGRFVIAGGANGVVYVWEPKRRYSKKRPFTVSFKGHKGAVWCVAFARDGSLAVSGGEDRSLRVWALPQ